ncbi:LruC domain-containing protein [Catenovulum sp. SM1970]|uniref:LruC domain-containing protein n=1 Tax=Marinifaba aquimaris TaxID=2741323 RepID=UPI001574798D|nr:LruC domain-containing protein [Marinifaba aquimaris]NTS76181.1 LruC domain-containing protein [Marinifaba aquimaris]
MQKLGISISSLLIFQAFSLQSAPFDDCPTEAFLIQKPENTAKTFGIDLSLGKSIELSENMNNQNGKALNGVGFSDHDDYMYGWYHHTNSLARVGNDYQIESMTLNKVDSNSQNASGFYAGDISTVENIWFGYKVGLGLFKVFIDGPNANKMEYVAGSKAKATLNLTDIAFHPDFNFLYAVTNGTTGDLVRISTDTGEIQVLDRVYEGDKATFGAQFFDVDGNMYISSNQSGEIYKIDISNPELIDEVFAYGPKSSSNDGARCANAPVLPASGTDYGDAPDSYGTAFEDNGARHGTSGITSLRLGDDISGTDDGVQFATGLETGESAIVLIEANQITSTSYLNAWIDWDQDGEFEADEQVLDNYQASANNQIMYQVPLWAEPGSTWSRFRISTTQDLSPRGGAPDGEVEDYPLTITETGVTLSYYPSASGYTSLVYEDNYPSTGDYDMNDVAMQLRIINYIKDNQIIRVGFEGRLSALGASYKNGFALRVPGLAASKVNGDHIKQVLKGSRVDEAYLESGVSSASIIIAEDLTEWIQTSSGCSYYRTQTGCTYENMPTWSVTVPFNSAVSTGSMPAYPYDPFIFATTASYHGDDANTLIGHAPGRALEIHLKNKAPTEKFNNGFFGYMHDYSNSSQNKYFLTENGMAWAMEVPSSWKHPMSGVSLDQAYPEFIDFATDDSGQTNATWYMSPETSKVFNN